MQSMNSYNPDVLTCLANLSNDEVFTPPTVATTMLNLLPKKIWEDPSIKFFDPCCKSGVFLREIVKRLNVGLTNEIPNQEDRLHHIFQKQVFGIALTELTSLLSRRTVYCSKSADGKYSVFPASSSEVGNIMYQPDKHKWEDDKCIYCGASKTNYDRGLDRESYSYNFIHKTKFEEFDNMKFDVIVGNPPYQLSDGGAQASAIPIYQHFVEQAKKLNPRFLTMIIPSRWFTSGKGLDDFRSQMISDKRIKELHDFHNASHVFPNVEIKGGVCYFLWDRAYTGDCNVVSHKVDGSVSAMSRPLKHGNLDTFIRYNEAMPMLTKVLSKKEQTFDTIVSSRKPFGLSTSFKNFSPESFDNALKIYANQKLGYVEKSMVTKNHQWIDKHKVIMPYAVGSGDGKTDKFNPIYSAPNSICTETYLVIGVSDNADRIHNIISYINTRFFHFLVTLRKNTQHATQTVFEFVPIQNFDKPWTDEELFMKYGFSNSEIEWITTNIIPEKS